MLQKARELYEFGPFRLDVTEQTLTRSDGRSNGSLPEKAFQTLCVLVRNSGRLLTKQELLNEVWPDSFVEENNLDKSIHAIRNALGDKRGERKYIETVSKHGYRFVADVHQIETVTENTFQPALDSILSATFLDRGSEIPGENSEIVNNPPEARLKAPENGLAASIASAENVFPPPKAPVKEVRLDKSLHIWAVAFAALVLGSIAVGYYLFFFESAADSGKKSIAVLPLKPINTASRDHIYELGIADSVIQKISSARNVVVRQLHTIRKYVDLDRDPVEIGKEQNVDFILASSYQIASGKIKVTSQLLDVATGKVEDTFTVEKDSTDLFSTQDAVASAIGSKLIARFGGAPTDAEPKRGTRNEEAYRLYLQGMYLVEKGTKAETKRSIELFDRAIDLDPNFAAAWAGKGNAHCSFSHMGDNSPAAEYEIARPAIERALELDSNLPEAYATLGVINTDFYWNFPEGEKQFLRAIELNPSSDYAYRWYGNRLVRYGRFDEAVAAMETAINNNPTNVFHHRIYGWVLYMARRHDEAIEQLERVVEMDPSSPWTYDNLWMAYHAKGDHVRAFEWFMKFHQQAGTGSELINRFNSEYEKTGWHGVLQTQQSIAEAKAREQKGKFTPAHYRVAVLSTLVGEKEQALESLNEAFKYRSANITFLKTDPALDSLRDDPRFDEIMRRAGF